MLPTNEGICGWIEFEPATARAPLPSRLGRDDSLQVTLMSLVDQLFETDLDESGIEWSSAEWTSESIIYANLDSLELELLRVYQLTKRGVR